LTVSNRDSQSNCWSAGWVNLRILGQPCEFYLRGSCPGCSTARSKRASERARARAIFTARRDYGSMDRNVVCTSEGSLPRCQRACDLMAVRS
jgi:hypothetical protein